MKTAVEHIEEQMLYKQIDYQEFSMLIREAKAMEEKQIKDAWLSAWKDSMLNPLSDECYREFADEYYKQKYTDESKSNIR